RCKPENYLLTKRQDGQVALHEGLLIGSELHPSALETLDNLRAGVKAEVEDLAWLLASGLHVSWDIAKHLSSGIADCLGIGIIGECRADDRDGKVGVGHPF